jgi:hypothetical protein
VFSLLARLVISLFVVLMVLWVLAQVGRRRGLPGSGSRGRGRVARRQVDVLINDNLLARGEVVVLDDEFGVRILDIVMSDGQPARH